MRIIEQQKLKEKTYYGWAGTSSESKPTDADISTDRSDDIAMGSYFLEVDTGDVYLYNETAGTWHKVGGSNE